MSKDVIFTSAVSGFCTLKSLVGDKALFDQLQGRETNDTSDPQNPRVWRLLINRGGQLYAFKALHKSAPAKERPLVLSISEKQLLILSPEATKKR
ncbi:hypothetical protein [Microcoleus sp. F4-D5]|uniref:hypothetical protein n=1 Tax=Microcoleus sp. F4-D5 TaxID=2818760 RepID=UPI002FD3D89F